MTYTPTFFCGLGGEQNTMIMGEGKKTGAEQLLAPGKKRRNRQHRLQKKIEG